MGIEVFYDVPEGLQTIAVLNKENHPSKPWEEVAAGLIVNDDEGLKVIQRTSLRLHFRPCCQKAVVFQTRMVLTDGESFECAMAGYRFHLGGPAIPKITSDRIDGSGTIFPPARPEARLTLDHWPIAVTGKYPLMPGMHVVRCARSDGRISLTIDGRVVLDAADPRPEESLTCFEFFLPENTIIYEAILQGRSSSLPGIPLVRKKFYHLSMSIDFLDDLMPAPWTKKTLRELMELYNRHKIKRIYFIDHCGYKGGFWDHFPVEDYPLLNKNIRQTYKEIGEFLPAMVAAGHKSGIEVYALYKPQEAGLGTAYPHGSENARRYGKVNCLSGKMWWLTNFAASHAEMRLERDMRRVPPDLDVRLVGKIILTAEEGLPVPFDPSRIRLWVSSDNARYMPYSGAMSITQPGKNMIVLNHLAIREKFMALTVEGHASHSFGNTLRELIAVRDQEGGMLPISYATQTGWSKNLPMEKACFQHDAAPSGISEMDNYYWLDSGRPLAIAKGWERHVRGMMCEAYPEVLSWWMENIEQYIAMGVDGVDVRNSNHNRTFDWDVFGYNKPLVEAFRKKHGIDMLSQPFKREDLRRLRGEYYSDFMRQAGQSLRTAGKKLHLHLDSSMQSPVWHTGNDIHSDWEGWIREGLIDELTLKMNEMDSEAAAKSFELAREHGLPLNYCPYLHPQLKGQINDLIQHALNAGVDDFTIYENSFLMTAGDDGGIVVKHPWALEALAEHARP